MIFSELINWVETDFSHQLADDMIRQSGVANDGAYTAGGYYPHGDVLAMLASLAGLTGQSPGDLARAYGGFLSGRLAALHPEFMAGQTDVRTFLRYVEPHIHSEVRKLHPEVRTPEIAVRSEDGGMTVTYTSHRPFAAVAHGLIEGFVAYFGEDWIIEPGAVRADGTGAEFRLVPPAT